MMMTGCRVDAGEARDMGLADLLAPNGGLDELVASFATDLLANSWHTNFATKRLMRETDGMSLAEGLAHEHYRYPGNAPDYQERIARFSKNSWAPARLADTIRRLVPVALVRSVESGHSLFAVLTGRSYEQTHYMPFKWRRLLTNSRTSLGIL